MIAERTGRTAGIRGSGESEREAILGDTNKQRDTELSEAMKKRERIMGEGDAVAARIYNEAYARDPWFYDFVETLKSYEETVGKKTRLVITTNSEFYKYLKNITGNR
jgi:membrane protease subunit HflC